MWIEAAVMFCVFQCLLVPYVAYVPPRPRNAVHFATQYILCSIGTVAGITIAILATGVNR